MVYKLIGHLGMKRLRAVAVPFAVSCAALLGSGGEMLAQTAPAGRSLGIYDPYGDFSSNKDMKIEHIFISWQDVDLSSLQKADDYAQARGRDLLITVEPWSWSNETATTRRQLQRGISRGQYDGQMAAICTAAGKLKSNTTIRWGHEMDNPNDHFPWAMWKPGDYIQAYRRMVDICRKAAPQLTYMWSPAGMRNARTYYPGARYADFVGVSVFGLQKYDIDKFGRSRTFSEVLAPAYARVANLGKPIVIAELGFVGDAEYVANWTRDSKAAHPQFPGIVASLYFNHEEVHPWPENYGLPNWRITRNVVP